MATIELGSFADPVIIVDTSVEYIVKNFLKWGGGIEFIY